MSAPCNPKGAYATAIKKAKDKPCSLRNAVNLCCWQCIGGDCDGGPQLIRDCEITACALGPVRPYQRTEPSDGSTEDAEGWEVTEA